MSDTVFKTIELTGSSPTGIEDAVNGAIRKAGDTVHNMRWFEVTEIRGQIEDGSVTRWQVSAKVGFKLDE